MKSSKRDHSRGGAALRATFLIVLSAVLPLLLYGSAPSWWSQRAVLIEGALDDFAPANQGQLKNIAKAAVSEMDAKLSGGAGDTLHQLVASWSNPGADTNDFAPLNVGQLKNVAKPFYDRLITAGLVQFYPWLISLKSADDFAAANIGQVKQLFSFEIPTANSPDDGRGGRIAASQRAGNLALEPNAVWGWGNRFDSNFQSTYPRRLKELSGIRSVSLGDDHFVVLADSGTVLTWGKNASGQLGNGTNLDRDAPATVPDLTNIVSAKAGSAHTVVLQEDGTVLAWGDNYYGQLGSGDNAPSSSPVQVVGLTDVRKVAASSSRSAALRSDGTVWTWGYDHYAWQTGQDISNNVPVAVPDLNDVVDVASGYEHVVAVKADGTVWAWGSNYANQLGNGKPWWQFQDVPAQVPNLRNVTKVASNFDHSLALLNDGTVWAWGSNSFGQLGDGTTQPRPSPIQVTGLTDVIAIATAFQHSLAMKTDGTVWTWGDGASGSLPGVDLHVPQQVGLGLFDTNQNGMDYRWEIQFLGDLNQSPDADFDGDGVSNRLEYLRGTDPRDYFNGITPIMEVVSGNNQIGDPGTFLPKPIIVRMKNTAGGLLINAPVDFKVSNGFGLVAGSPGEALQDDILVRTDASGQASAYVMLSPAAGTTVSITASPAGPGSASSAVAITFRAGSRFVLPASPTPTPDPNSSATPSPSPTPGLSALPPYRYAIIDLGKDVYPIRINNKSGILCEGPDANDSWGFYRWKGGNLERLQDPGYFSDLSAADMNDDGTVVGWEGDEEGNRYSWVNNAENEFQVGLIWPSGSSVPARISGPAKPSWNQFQPGTMRVAYLSAISNPNPATSDVDVYGGAYTGGAYMWFWYLDIHNIMNAHRWTGTSAPVPLSFSTSINTQAAGALPLFDWREPMDRVTRANSSRHYIGQRKTPNGQPVGAIVSGMIDGQAVDFDPVDLNEAGLIVGSGGTGMVMYASPTLRATIEGAYPLAVNDHTRPAPSQAAQASPTPTPIPVPQILGWSGNDLTLWERLEDLQTWHPFSLEEMIPSMDGWENLDPYDMNDSGLIVGTADYSDPSYPGAQSERHGFLLVPAELVPDYNRDGRIDDNDRGQVNESNPWRWWINDDDDSGETGGTDFPHEGAVANSVTEAHPDGTETGTIDGIRDLIDFFPLYLNIQELLNIFPVEGPGQFTFNLKQEGGAANCVYTDLSAGSASDYLRKIVGSAFDNATSLGGTQNSSGAVTQRITMEGIKLDPAWLKKIDSNAHGLLLIEGRTRDNRPIVLEVYDSHSHKVMDLRLPVSFSSVEQMYRHKNLMAADNASGGRPDYATGDDTLHPEPENYPDTLCSNKSFVFVHGYNVDPESARGWNAEMFKRMHQSGSRAKFCGVTWHGAEISGGVVPDYHLNVNNAFATAGSFANLVKGLGGQVVVVAHSLGNIVVSSAIQDWSLTPVKYFMVDGAVAQESYDDAGATDDAMAHPEWQQYPCRVWASEWYANGALPANDGRRALSWRDRFVRVRTESYNFFSKTEDVLRTHEGDPGVRSVIETALTRGRHSWALQEKLKGRQVDLGIGKCGSTYGGWRFSQNIHAPGPIPPDQAAILSDSSLTINPVFDPGFTIRVSPPPPNGETPLKDIHAGAPAWIVDLTGSVEGSEVAREHRNQLLAEMFPARTLPVGAHELVSLEDRNFDMPELFVHQWPVERGAITDWLHSDVKVVAYPFIWELFTTWVSVGEL